MRGWPWQGKEADIVIFSCVRAHDGEDGRASVGFLADVRRMNVALTRARYAMILGTRTCRTLSVPANHLLAWIKGSKVYCA